MNINAVISALLFFGRGRLKRLAKSIVDFQLMSPAERRTHLAVRLAAELKITPELARGIVTEAYVRSGDVRQLVDG